MSLADAFIRIRPDTSGFSRDARGYLRDEMGRFVAQNNRDLAKGGKVGGGLFGRGIARGVGPAVAGIGAALATAGVGAFLKSTVAEAREANKIAALTAAAIKSTGGAAKVTAGQVSKLAEAISNKVAVDDEAVQSSSNLLLTFTKVRNEVGKGNDIFNQATMATVDMAAVLGGTAADNAIKLGKALNDPLKGVTALSKVGVSFTEQQKKQIETLVKHGDVLGAQKIILKELAVEFGGAAAAIATPAQRLAVHFGNLKEKIGAALIPTLDRLSTFATDRVLPALEKMGAAFQSGKLTSGGFTGFLEKVGVAARNVGTWITGTAVPAIQRLAAGFSSGEGTSGMAKFGITLRNVAMWVRDVALPAIRNFAGYLRDTVFPVVMKIARDAMPGIRSAVDDVTTAFRENRPQLESLWASFKGFVNMIVTRVLPILGPVLRFVFTQMGRSMGDFITIVTKFAIIFRGLATVVAQVSAVIARTFLNMVGTVISGAAKAFGWMGPLGGKLRGAAAEFGKFKDGVNRHIKAITPGKNVTITASARVNPYSGQARVGSGTYAQYKSWQVRAKGGPIPRVPGSVPNRDSVPTLTMPGEFVVTKTGSNLGAALKYFGAPGYALGGEVRRSGESRIGTYGRQVAGNLEGGARFVGEGLLKFVTSGLGKWIGEQMAAQAALIGRSGGYGGVKPWVAAVGDAVQRMFGRMTVGGVGQRGNVSDHPTGHALDFMTGSNKSLGQRIAGHLTANWSKYNVKYLIWDAMYAGTPGRWTRYSHPAGRTDATAMHRDHVHASFLSSPRGRRINAGEYDQGGWLEPGLNLAYNGTGRREQVLPAGQDTQSLAEAFATAIAGMTLQLRIDPSGLATVVAVGNRQLGRRG